MERDERKEGHSRRSDRVTSESRGPEEALREGKAGRLVSR